MNLRFPKPQVLIPLDQDTEDALLEGLPKVWSEFDLLFSLESNICAELVVSADAFGWHTSKRVEFLNVDWHRSGVTNKWCFEK